MPRTRSLAWAELKIGIVTIFALFMATMLVFLLGGEGGFFWQRYGLKTVFPNVAGLKAGAPVRIAGIEVGAVTDIVLVGERAEILMEISREYEPVVTTMSTASLGSVSLLGESAVDIIPATGGTPVPEWGYVPTGVATGSLAEVTTQATAGIQELTAILQDIRAGRGTIGQLFADDALYAEMTALVGAAEDVARNVAEGRGTLGRLANNPAAAQSLEASLKTFETIMARLRAGEGSAGRLLNDDALANNLTATTSNIEAITGRINRGEGTAGRLITDRQLYDRFNSVAERIDKIVLGLEQGEGTAGQLLRNRQLYENMNGTIGEMQKLIADIRADPRKFLTVRVSIF